MEAINFKTNWNNKLSNDCFTTLRRSKKYKRGIIYPVKLKDKLIGKVKVLAIREYKIKDLPDFICQIDTGCTKKETIEILSKIYKTPTVIIENETIQVLLMKYTEKLIKNNIVIEQSLWN